MEEGDVASAGAGAIAGACAAGGETPPPPVFCCTVLMAEVMPLLMADTAMLSARCGLGGLLGLLSYGVGGSAKPPA
jgi:hypothetical protein